MTDYETGILLGFLGGWVLGGLGALMMLGLCRTAADDRDESEW